MMRIIYRLHGSLIFSEDNSNTVNTTTSPEEASSIPNHDELQVSILFLYYLQKEKGSDNPTASVGDITWTVNIQFQDV